MQVNELIIIVNKDLTKGVYDNFPDLKRKLTNISKSLIRMKNIVNAELNDREIKLLIENDYLKKVI